MKKIVIAGGTGFIGTYLKTKFEALGYTVIIISRQEKFANWNNVTGMIEALNNAEMLITLPANQ